MELLNAGTLQWNFMTENDRIYGLWLANSPGHFAARDLYLGLARETGGPVAVIEAGSRLLGRRIEESGLDADCFSGEPGSEDPDDGMELGPGGLANFAPSRNYRLALIPFGGFSRLWRPSDREALLARLHGALLPGGLLALDLPAPATRFAEGFWDTPRLAADLKYQDGSSTVVWETRRKPQSGAGIEEITLGVESITAEGRVGRKIYRRMLAAPLETREVAVAAERAGFVTGCGRDRFFGRGDAGETGISFLLFIKREMAAGCN